MAQQQNIRKFVLGGKEFEDKKAEFSYDRGWYSITDIVGEERKELYRSRNAQEAYMKWNVYIGRKKERPIRENHKEEREPYKERRGRRSSSDRDSGELSRQEESGKTNISSGAPKKAGGKANDRYSDRNQTKGRGEYQKSDRKQEQKKDHNFDKRSTFKKGKGDKHNAPSKGYTHKNNRPGKPKKQYKRQDSKIKTRDWDNIE